MAKTRRLPVAERCRLAVRACSRANTAAASAVSRAGRRAGSDSGAGADCLRESRSESRVSIDWCAQGVRASVVVCRACTSRSDKRAPRGVCRHACRHGDATSRESVASAVCRLALASRSRRVHRTVQARGCLRARPERTEEEMREGDMQIRETRVGDCDQKNRPGYRIFFFTLRELGTTFLRPTRIQFLLGQRRQRSQGASRVLRAGLCLCAGRRHGRMILSGLAVV